MSDGNVCGCLTSFLLYNWDIWLVGVGRSCVFSFENRFSAVSMTLFDFLFVASAWIKAVLTDWKMFSLA